MQLVFPVGQGPVYVPVQTGKDSGNPLYNGENTQQIYESCIHSHS